MPEFKLYPPKFGRVIRGHLSNVEHSTHGATRHSGNTRLMTDKSARCTSIRRLQPLISTDGSTVLMTNRGTPRRRRMGPRNKPQDGTPKRLRDKRVLPTC